MKQSGADSDARNNGGSQGRFRASLSEIKLQSELDLPRAISLPSDRSKTGAEHIEIGSRKAHPVENVKHFSTKLHVHLFSDGRALHNAEVLIQQREVSCIGEYRRGVSKGIRGRRGKGLDVEIAICRRIKMPPMIQNRI